MNIHSAGIVKKIKRNGQVLLAVELVGSLRFVCEAGNNIIIIQKNGCARKFIATFLSTDLLIKDKNVSNDVL